MKLKPQYLVVLFLFLAAVLPVKAESLKGQLEVSALTCALDSGPITMHILTMDGEKVSISRQMPVKHGVALFKLDLNQGSYLVSLESRRCFTASHMAVLGGRLNRTTALLLGVPNFDVADSRVLAGTLPFAVPIVSVVANPGTAREFTIDGSTDGLSYYVYDVPAGNCILRLAFYARGPHIDIPLILADGDQLIRRDVTATEALHNMVRR